MKIMKSSILGMLMFAPNVFSAENQNELDIHGMNYDESFAPDFLGDETNNAYVNEYEQNDNDAMDTNQNVGHGRRLTVFPPDDRVEYSPEIYQRGVGLLSSTNNGAFKNCTATLVNRELILTAASCIYQDVIDGSGNVINRTIPSGWTDSAVFHFGYTNGHPSPFSSQIKQIFVPGPYQSIAPTWPEFNFAILQLKDALGDATGFMNIKPIAATDYGYKGVSLVSFMFKNDTTASADYCCAIIGNVDGRAKHICDTAYGSAGAPLYIQIQNKKSGKFSYELVAMNNEEGPTFNLAAATKPISELFLYAKKHISKDPRFNGPHIDFSNDCDIICNNTMPTKQPATHPTRKTIEPTTRTGGVTDRPTITSPLPTSSPTASPTYLPTHKPTKKPHRSPTRYPYNRPTGEPTTGVTDRPTPAHTIEPTTRSGGVTDRPTSTKRPTRYPHHRPTVEPTNRGDTSSPTTICHPSDLAKCPGVLEPSENRTGLRM